jgi:hypothetical protein
VERLREAKTPPSPATRAIPELKGLLVFVGAALLLGTEIWPQAAPPPPLTGFSYSPLISTQMNRNPVDDLSLLLAWTNPDVVRLPVYWDAVQPSPDRLDFTSVDQLLATVEQHNLASDRQTRVVLTIGARNFLYPELHAPAWAGPRQQPELGEIQSGPTYRLYFDSSIVRYRASPLVYAWQVENEPFDDTANADTGDDRIDAAQVAWEMGEVRRLDPGHEAYTTTYDGWNVTIDMLQVYAPPLLDALHAYPSGHPQNALDAGDALGLDLYIYGPKVPPSYISNSQRSEWKAQAVSYWADRAGAQGKQVWLAEMQAQPWGTLSGFVPADLIDSALDYRQERLQVVLLWGVDTWLTNPAWLAAANQAQAILRSS